MRVTSWRRCRRRDPGGDDLRNEKINYKVREHSLAKVPNLVVVGKREAEERTVALRVLGSDARQEVLGLDALVARLKTEALAPDLVA
jgi:threonyl-tRNA synthetase